jgi:hypothetical protein
MPIMAIINMVCTPRYGSSIMNAYRNGWENVGWEKGFNLLHAAAMAGDLESCKFFLSKCGADPRGKDDNDRTPEIWAARSEQDEVRDLEKQFGKGFHERAALMNLEKG